MRNLLLTILVLVISFSDLIAQTPLFNVLRKKDNSMFDGIITSIHRDAEGYLWFGAPMALMRYDGNTYLEFTNSKDDSTSLSHTDIETIFEDSQHRLWFGSKFGLNLYNKDNQSFKRIYPYPEPVDNINKNRIKGICQENDSIFWIASYGGGVCRYNCVSGRVTHFLKSEKEGSLPSNIVNTVFFDSKGRLWVGTESGGLSLMDTKTGLCKNYLPDRASKNALSDNTVSSIIEDRKGILWIGTWRGGLNSFDPQNELFTSYADKLPSKTIRTIIRGNGDYLWLATFKGLVRFNTISLKFDIYQHDPYDPESLHYDVNWSLCFDSENILWVGSMGRGVCFSHLSGQTFRMPEKWGIKYGSSYINALQLDGSVLWVGTEDAGVLRWDINKKQFLETPFNTKLNGQIIYCIEKDSKKKIWIGTNTGLYNIKSQTFSQNIDFNTTTKGFSIYSIVEDGLGGYIAGGWNTGIIQFNERKTEVFKVDSKCGLPADIIWKMYIDSKNRIWVLSAGGIGIWNPVGHTFEKLHNDPNMFAINQDEYGNVWCGSSFGEIFIFNEETRKFDVFYKFESPYRVAGLHHTKKILWILTQDGLMRMDKHTKQYRRFSVSDGLPSNYFTWSSETLPDGNLIMGTASGPAVMDPEYIPSFSFIPNLVISSLEVFDKKRSFSDNHISLAYDENKITIGFTALSLALNGITSYTYQMQGVDKEPVVTTDQKATYTNLSPGTYTFVVTYKTADGITPKEATKLTITVATPWWSTLWFRILTAIFIISVLILIMYYRTKSIKQRNKELELEVGRRTSELRLANDLLNNQNITLSERKKELENLNETKTKLFSIIGHDLKNPLSVIISSSELLTHNLKENEANHVRKFINAINNSSRNAFNLLTNLLDWARSQQDSVHLVLEPVSIKQTLQDVYQLNKELLASKQIELTIRVETDKNAMADKNLLHTCIRNCISNAIKYSFQSSNILVRVLEEESGSVVASIKDSGMGMTSDRLERIFSIKKSSHPGTANERGTGLGLVIVKEFMTLLGGTIRVMSEEKKGTEVILTFPATDKRPVANNPEDQNQISNEEIVPSLSEESLRFLKGKQLLIVDDDEDLRMSLRSILEQFATVHEAENGEIGYEKIIELNPDLVICDVEMPVCSGVEMCKRVKNNASVSHTPVIMLTALNSNTDTIKGLQSGADEYLSKPFNKEILLLKILYVFRLRNELHTLFKVNETVEVKEGSVSSVDEVLLQKIIALVNENLSNPDFSVEDISDSIGMHRSHLSRKMNALTNMSTNEFIRMIRLRKAAELLKTGKLTVAEVAYDTGFNDARYFSKCFKEFFGKIPSTFIQE